MKNLLCVLILVFCSTVVFSQTTIPGGDVSGTWLQSGSPYLIEGEITIPNGETLTIDPGCLIEFQGCFGIGINGKLHAIGTAQDSIKFSIADINLGWNGLQFSNTTPEMGLSILDFVEVCHSQSSAIYCYNVTNIIVSNSYIHNNQASGCGGGFNSMYSDIEIYNSNITNNIARNISSPQGNQPGEGGGIMSHSSNLILSNCIFFNNEAEGGIDSSKGGAISNQGGDIIFNNCLLYNNYAQEGDAIYSTSSNATLNNSIISGIYATQNSSNLNITNSIFWNHNPYGGSGIYISTWNPGSVTISYSCVKNGQSGITPNGGTINWLTGNIEDDPLFIDPENGDFHFFANSPCINAGTPDTTGLNLPEYDLDGNPRIYEDRIDMGCYEWQGTEADDNQLPMTSYQLFNYPNPFNPETTISFYIIGSEDNEQKVSISIFNIRGQKIKTLINKALIPGRYSVIWNSKDENNKPCSSGIYFYKLDVDSKTKATKKMLLLK